MVTLFRDGRAIGSTLTIEQSKDYARSISSNVVQLFEIKSSQGTVLCTATKEPGKRFAWIWTKEKGATT